MLPRKRVTLLRSNQELIDDAKRFSSRSEWRRNSNAYEVAQRRGMLNDCCQHMERKASSHTGLGIIYAYRFSDKCAYVGLTINPKNRIASHLKRGPVFNKIQSGLLYEYIVLEDCPGDPTYRVSREDHWMKWHAENGWSLINKRPAGACGAVAIRWTLNRLKKDALRFNTRGEWRIKSGSAYWKACSRGLLDSLCGHMASGKTKGAMSSPERIMRGPKNGRAKLTVESVKKIRSMVDLGISYRKIAPQFSVAASTINRIASGELWGSF